MQITQDQIAPDHPLAPRSIQEARQRLLGLAQYLETPWGRNGHQEFDFSKIARLRSRSIPETMSPEEIPATCGTIGCAVGALPYCYPETFGFNLPALLGTQHSGLIYPKGYETNNPMVPTYLHWDIGLAACWFGLDECQTRHLFVPGAQCQASYGGVPLDGNATAPEVAHGIRSFCKVVLDRCDDTVPAG